MENFCKSLPKVELHAHLNGSLSARTLIELKCIEKDVGEYQKLVNVINKTDKTLKECFQLFNIAQKVTASKENLYIATCSVIEEFADDNVIYLELRTTPRAEDNMSKYEYIETIIKAIECNKKDIIVKLLLSINRQHSLEQSADSLNVIMNLKQKYPDIVKGLDLSGNPYVGTFNKDLFETARNRGLHTVIHCAEIKNDQEVRNILQFRPDRIGHATFLHPQYGGSEGNWDLYCTSKIPTECCLTSNVMCGTSPSYKDHHIKQWIKNSLPFCINTDDKGVFCTTLSQEYEYASRYFNLSRSHLYDISHNAIDYSFASAREKQLLREKLANWKQSNTEIFL